MSSVTYTYKQLEDLCTEAFTRFGFSREDAAQITDVLLLADLYGTRSHGTQRIVRYHKSIENNAIHVDAKPEIVFETPVSAVIDGHSGMGQLISHFAMKLAIEKAKKVGMAFVSVRNSNHFGIAGYYTKMACDEGLVGIATTNTQAIMVPTNGAETILGTNPLAFAMPAEPYPFWFDASTTVVPRGKLEVYNKEDKEMPEGWGVGADGQVSTDAEHVLNCIDTKGCLGGILPLGGATEDHGSHKGYGYAMVSEMFSSIFSFGHTSNHHVRVKGQGAGTCHGFMVIDPKIFGDAEQMKKDMSVFLQELRDSKRANPDVPVYTHGEKEMLAAERHMKEGIEVNINTVGEMKNLCLAVGMDPIEYLGDVDTSNTKASIYDNLYK